MLTQFFFVFTTSVPSKNEWTSKIETEHFVYGSSKELMNILSLTLWKHEIRGKKVVATTTTTTIIISMVRSAYNHDMCTHAMSSDKTECDLNIYELECELIEWAEWEWVRQWIKMWCDNAANHHMECSECERACVHAYICSRNNVFICMHFF